MPNIKSAKKRVKVISVKTLQNKMFKTQLKTDIKKYEAAVEAGGAAAARLGEVIATHVIPRPHTDVDKLLPKI
mgnify:CR=1 FL=1